jgi:excinuclease ABC subunit A
MDTHIRVRGARTHNLKNIDIDIPKNKLVVITGLSGSGKSSLAFDTLYAEGQRRYVESLSSYARQFLSMMEKPDVDSIDGLSPAIAIEQKATSHNPRSTVGTVTEIYDYFRLLFARVGTPRCPTHGCDLHAQTISQMVDRTLELPADTRAMILAPVVRGKKGEHKDVLTELVAQGYIRARIDGELVELDTIPKLDGKKKHDIEAVIDRFKVRDDIKQRLAESFETAIKLGNNLARVEPLSAEDGDFSLLFSSKFACPHCGYSIAELEPRLFSFNSPHGACGSCDGLGYSEHFDFTRIVAHPELPVGNGAIHGWDKRNAYTKTLLAALATHYQFDLETAWQDLPEPIQHNLLHGSGNERIALPAGRYSDAPRPWEGILPWFERRFKDSEFESVKTELAQLRIVSPCPSCDGSRLNEAARHVFIADMSLPQLTRMPLNVLHDWISTLTLTGNKAQIADKILKEISNRLGFLIQVGLSYLTLERSAETLSGGEAQRIRLASQIGSGLTGVMYVLDEPSIGLHQRDNDRLLASLRRLRDLGNTVIVVEHDEDAMRQADYLVDIGTGAGVHGGHIVAQGTPEEVIHNPLSLTGQYLNGTRGIAIPARHAPTDKQLVLVGANTHNLQNVTLNLPVGLFTCITGVSGSGKSTLINDTLYRIAANALNGASLHPESYERIEGLEHFDKVINIDQSPIGRTPRSNPATYTGLFTPIRELLAGVPESRARGYTPGRFSFNVAGGRCEACQGDGVIKVEMHFLPDIYVPCDVCHGSRYNRETLDIRYKGKSIADMLGMTIEDALVFFDAVPTIKRKLATLMDVGLSYLKLGQSATTLSGGEAQRIKLAKELSKRDTGNTLYILDEPTTGLHFHDIELLLTVLHRLRDHGNTIVVIEHNLDVIKTADWLIDLGPEGGNGGGQIIAQGTPETLAACEHSWTGTYLKPLLARNTQ